MKRKLAIIVTLMVFEIIKFSFGKIMPDNVDINLIGLRPLIPIIPNSILKSETLKNSNSMIDNLIIKKKIIDYLGENFIKNKEMPPRHYEYLRDIKTRVYYYERVINSEEQINALQQLKFDSNSLNNVRKCFKNEICESFYQKKEFDKKNITTTNRRITSAIKNIYIKFSKYSKTLKPLEVGNFIVNKKESLNYEYGQTSLTEIYASLVREGSTVYLIAIVAEAYGKVNKRYVLDVNGIEYQNSYSRIHINLIETILRGKIFLAAQSKYYVEKEKLINQLNPDYKIQTNEIKKAYLDKLQNLVKRQITSRVNTPTKERYLNITVNIFMDLFSQNQLDVILKKYELSSEVGSILQEILFQKEYVEVKSNKKLADNIYEQALGYAIRDKGTILVVLAVSKVTAKFPLYSEAYEEKECERKTIFKIKKCKIVCKYRRKSISDSELENLKAKLHEVSLDSILNKLSIIEESQTLLGSNGYLVSPRGKYKAVISENGEIIVGAYDNPIKYTTQTIGKKQDPNNGPFTLQVKDDGRMYIMSQGDDKLWTSNFHIYGEAPFSLYLDDDGCLLLSDYKGKLVYKSSN